MMKLAEQILTPTMDNMRIEDQIKSDYFEWMYKLMCGGRFAKSISYRKLFTALHDAEFTYFVPHDENRAEDGIALRYRYCVMNNCENLEHYINGPCSVLEMMVALAIRCEERIMCNPDKGDRTAQWFWEMIGSLGLSSMSDYNFNEQIVDDAVWKLLNRKYNRNGKGGLFTVRGWRRDAREAEIWHQLMAYLNSLE